MKPIDSFKKLILNKLSPLIEKQNSNKKSEANLFKSEDSNPSGSVTSRKDRNEQYSDLLEDSEYPKE